MTSYMSENGVTEVRPRDPVAVVRRLGHTSVTERCVVYIDIYIIYLFHKADVETFQRVLTRSLSALVSGYGAQRPEVSKFHHVSRPHGARSPETRARRDTSLTSTNACFPSSGTRAAPRRDTEP